MQQTLFDLPNFEGRRPSTSGLKLTGSVKTPCRALHLGDTVILVAEATVVAVDHKADEDGPIERIHALKVSEAHELRDGEDALEVGRAWSQQVEDAHTGRLPLRAAGGGG